MIGSIINNDHLEFIGQMFSYIQETSDKNNKNLTSYLKANEDFLSILFDTTIQENVKYFCKKTKAGRFCHYRLKKIIWNHKPEIDVHTYISRLNQLDKMIILCVIDLHLACCSLNQRQSLFDKAYGNIPIFSTNLQIQSYDLQYVYELYIYYELKPTETLEQNMSNTSYSRTPNNKLRPYSASTLPSKTKLSTPILERWQSSRYIGGSTKYGDKCLNDYCQSKLQPIIDTTIGKIDVSLDTIIMDDIGNTHGTCMAVAYMTCVINTFNILKQQNIKLNLDNFNDSCLSKLLYLLITSPDNKFAILDAILYSKDFRWKLLKSTFIKFNIYKKLNQINPSPDKTEQSDRICSNKINPVGPISTSIITTFQSIIENICDDNVIIKSSVLDTKYKLTKEIIQKDNIYDLVAFTVDNYNIHTKGHIFAVFKDNNSQWKSYQAHANDSKITEMLDNPDCDDILHTSNNGLRYNIKKTYYQVGFYIKRQEQSPRIRPIPISIWDYPDISTYNKHIPLLPPRDFTIYDYNALYDLGDVVVIHIDDIKLIITFTDTYTIVETVSIKKEYATKEIYATYKDLQSCILGWMNNKCSNIFSINTLTGVTIMKKCMFILKNMETHTSPYVLLNLNNDLHICYYNSLGFQEKQFSLTYTNNGMCDLIIDNSTTKVQIHLKNIARDLDILIVNMIETNAYYINSKWYGNDDNYIIWKDSDNDNVMVVTNETFFYKNFEEYVVLNVNTDGSLSNIITSRADLKPGNIYIFHKSNNLTYVANFNITLHNITGIVVQPKTTGIIHILGYNSPSTYYYKLLETNTSAYKLFYNDSLTFLGVIYIIAQLKTNNKIEPDTFTRQIFRYIKEHANTYCKLSIIGESYGGLVASQILQKYVIGTFIIQKDEMVEIKTYGSLFVPKLKEIERIRCTHDMIQNDIKYACILGEYQYYDKYITDRDITDALTYTCPVKGGNKHTKMYTVKINKANKHKYISLNGKNTYLKNIPGKYRYYNDSTISLCKTMKLEK